MSRILRLLKTSIGQKLVMAVTGLLLILFLIAHLGGNLLLFAGPETFNEYSHELVTNPLIYLAEAGLLVIFCAHVVMAFRFKKRSLDARPEEYRMRSLAGGASRKDYASVSMIWTGLVILAFVPIHIWTFKFGPEYASPGNPEVRDLARLVVEEFQHPGYVIWYVVAMGTLGVHLWWAFGSAFETLGLAHRPWLRRTGKALAFVLATGFAAIPVVIFATGGLEEPGTEEPAAERRAREAGPVEAPAEGEEPGARLDGPEGRTR